MDFHLQCDSCPEDQQLVPPTRGAAAAAAALSKLPRHSRSLSAPVYQPSLGGPWDFLQGNSSLTLTARMVQKGQLERRRKRKLSLEQDVRELEVLLQCERAKGRILEQALGSSFEPLPAGISTQTRDLIEEVAELEVQVFYLEALRRKLEFLRSAPPQHRLQKVQKSQHRRHVSAAQTSSSYSSNQSRTKTRPASLFGGNSSIDERGASSDLAIQVYTPSVQGAQTRDSSVHKVRRKRTPNQVSEEMVRCMAAIYCKLSDPPVFLARGGGVPSLSPPFSASTSSSSTSRDVSSSDGGWSPHWKDRGTEGLPRGPTIEVPWIRVDKERLSYASRALRSFKLLVELLEEVHPRDLKHDEKLAFWINVYNALVMHAYLAYGIPKNLLKRVSLLQKAAYKVGAYSVNAYTIEHSILSFRPQRPAQWLHALLFHTPLTKFKTEERRAYTLNSAEPMVCFALCSGGRSDPLVRVYRPENIRKELEAAKRDFLQANVSIRDNSILLPKLVDSYARDAKISSSHKSMLDWLYQNATEQQQQQLIKKPSSRRSFEWLAYDFNFKYSFAREAP